ncbi:hypothetical protein T08_10521, partial [Trichinella sp. T8]
MERFFQLHSEIKLLLTFCESSQMVQKYVGDYNLKNQYGVLKIGEENKLIRLGKNDAVRCIAS